MAAQRLAQRVLGDERGQLLGDLLVAAERQVEVGRELERGEPLAVEPGRVGLRERLGDVGVRRPAPQVQPAADLLARGRQLARRATRPGRGQEVEEGGGVQAARRYVEPVARRDGGHLDVGPALAQPAAQPRDHAVEVGQVATTSGVTPDPIEDRVGRDDPPRVDHERGQDLPVPGRPQLDGRAVPEDLQRAEHLDHRASALDLGRSVNPVFARAGLRQAPRSG